MSLFLLTGPVRSGKSALAQRLAEANATEFVAAVAGRPDDPEMERRIQRHKADRGDGWATLELTPERLAGPAGPTTWMADVPRDHVLVVDCLGTLVTALMDGLGGVGSGELADPKAESRVQEAVDAVVEALLARPGLAIVVSNEVGWGVVPASPVGRLFRDVMGRANRALATRADIALLVVSGRVISLTDLPSVEEF
jgi:adenosylcobinamide kinase/adenosylcobinamide-phosphate guanylyltransferase